MVEEIVTSYADGVPLAAAGLLSAWVKAIAQLVCWQYIDMEDHVPPCKTIY